MLDLELGCDCLEGVRDERSEPSSHYAGQYYEALWLLFLSSVELLREALLQLLHEALIASELKRDV